MNNITHTIVLVGVMIASSSSLRSEDSPIRDSANQVANYHFRLLGRPAPVRSISPKSSRGDDFSVRVVEPQGPAVIGKRIATPAFQRIIRPVTIGPDVVKRPLVIENRFVRIGQISEETEFASHSTQPIARIAFQTGLPTDEVEFNVLTEPPAEPPRPSQMPIGASESKPEHNVEFLPRIPASGTRVDAAPGPLPETINDQLALSPVLGFEDKTVPSKLVKGPRSVLQTIPATSESNITEVVTQPVGLFDHDRRRTVTGDGNWPCDTCLQQYCCCRDIQWRFRGDAVFLHRSRPGGDVTLASQTSGNLRSINPDSISMGTHGGTRISLTRENETNGLTVEGVYYLVDHWTGTNYLAGDIDSFGVSLGSGAVDARFESDFQNAELNVRRAISNWTQLIAGARWIRLEEHASLIGGGNVVPLFIREASTENELIGGQVGLRHAVWDRGGMFSANGLLKTGIYHNDVRRTNSGFGPPPQFGNETSFVGELDLDLNFEVTETWTLTLGYQAIWITDVAEAVSQMNAGNLAAEDSITLHGLRVGLMHTW